MNGDKNPLRIIEDEYKINFNMPVKYYVITLISVRKGNGYDCRINDRTISFWIDQLSTIFDIESKLKLKLKLKRDSFEKKIQNLRMIKAIKDKSRIIDLLKQKKLTITEEGLISESYFGFLTAESLDLKLAIGIKEGKKKLLSVDIETLVYFPISFNLKRVRYGLDIKNQYKTNQYFPDFTLKSLNNKNTIDFIKLTNNKNNNSTTRKSSIYYEIMKLCKNSESITFSGDQLTINIELEDDSIHLWNVLTNIFAILSILYDSPKNEQLRKFPIFDTHYLCLKCKMQLSFRGNLCYNCGTPTPRCIICWKDPEITEKVMLLHCCGFHGHENHINDWLRNKNVCPICKVKNPLTELVEVKY